MRLARLSSISAVLGLVALLAACGGGGGGGSVTPPGGGGGGGPSATPTATPTGHPTATPTPTGAPSATPTPTMAPTATPTPTAAPTSTPTPTPGPTATPTGAPGQTTIQVGAGEINGTDNQIVSSAPNDHGNAGEGDLMPGDPGATPQGGGQGATIDNVSCASSMSNDYHVHVFVGLMVNGQEVAIPDGVGMVDPSGDMTDSSASPPIPNQELYATCFYYMHTHDASGMVHLEAPAGFNGAVTCGPPVNFNPPCNYSVFTFGNLLDIWGISMSSGNFGPFAGTVQVYATPQKVILCQSGQSACYTPSSDYSLYTGDPAQMQLYSHMAVWILVNTPVSNPATLPNIEWMTGSQ